LALLAMSKSLRFIPSFSPAYTVKYRCVMTCTKLKKNSAGAVDTICLILPLAPIVTKKSCIASAASASPLGAKPPIFLGNAVASATVTRVTMGMIHCTPTPAAPAMYVPKAQIEAATVSAYEPLFTSNALDSLAFKMTSLLASSRATPWLGSFRSYAWSMSGALRVPREPEERAEVHSRHEIVRGETGGDEVGRYVEDARDGDVVDRAADVPGHERGRHGPRVLAEAAHGHHAERQHGPERGAARAE